MIISIASDHAGISMRIKITDFLLSKHIRVIDHGAFKSDGPVDYPDYAKLVAEDVSSGLSDRGILICGTGIGMCITANKVKGIRAANVYDLTTARLASEHNWANIITLGSRQIAFELVRELIDCWLITPHDQRHKERIEKITAIEEEGLN